MLKTIQKYLGPYNRKESEPDEGPRVESGARGRDSYINPLERDRRTQALILPDEKKQFRLKLLTVKELFTSDAATALQRLIETNDGMNFAVDTYIDHTVRGFDIIGDEPAKNNIEGYIDRGLFDETTLKRTAYGAYVEGAVATELSFTEDGEEAQSIDYISPLSLAADKRFDETIKDYYVIGQPDNFGRLNPVLYDPLDPSDTFIYTLVTVRGTKPLGTSSITPAIFATTSMGDLLRTLVAYTEAQVGPGGMFTIDAIAMKKGGGYTDEQLKAISDELEEKVRIARATGDFSQIFFSRIPMEFVRIAPFEKGDVGAVDTIMDILVSSQQRGLKVPRAMFGGRRTGTSLGNDKEVEYEVIDFWLRIINLRDVIETDYSKHFDTINRHDGILGSARLKLNDDDFILKRILTEIFGMVIGTVNDMKETGIFLDEERRKMAFALFPFLTKVLESSDLPEGLPAPQPEPTPPAQEPTNE